MGLCANFRNPVCGDGLAFTLEQQASLIQCSAGVISLKLRALCHKVVIGKLARTGSETATLSSNSLKCRFPVHAEGAPKSCSNENPQRYLSFPPMNVVLLGMLMRTNHDQNCQNSCKMQHYEHLKSYS